MATAGRIVRFDEIKGYGFVVSELYDEDLFFHVNELEIDKRLVRVGAPVEFDVNEGDRGLKAVNVRLAEGAEQPSYYADVLTRTEYTAEVTEALIKAAPSITGEQVVRIRARLLELAESHDWVSGSGDR